MDDLLNKTVTQPRETRHNRKTRVKANRIEETKKQQRKVRRKARIARRDAAEKANANWPWEKIRREEEKIQIAKEAAERKEADRLAKEKKAKDDHDAKVKEEAEAAAKAAKEAEEAAELAKLEAEEAKPKGILSKIAGAVKGAIMGTEKKE